jgi:hypothetical protein
MSIPKPQDHLVGKAVKGAAESAQSVRLAKRLIEEAYASLQKVSHVLRKDRKLLRPWEDSVNRGPE